MNPLSKAFLFRRQGYVRNFHRNSRSLDVGSSRNPVSDRSIKLDLRKKSGVEIVSTVLDLPFVPGAFDCVTMLEVIEHVDYELQRKAISEIYRVLKKGGTFIISTPSMFPSWKFVWFVWENTIQKEYRHDHVGQLYPQETLDLLTGSGFKVEHFKRVMLFDFIVVCSK